MKIIRKNLLNINKLLNFDGIFYSILEIIKLGKSMLRMYKYMFLLVMSLAMLSCGKDNPDDFRVDVNQAMQVNVILDKSLSSKILAESDFSDCDFVFVNYLASEKYINSTKGKLIPPQPSLLMIAKDIEKVSEVSVNGDMLVQTSPIIYPGYFFQESKNLDLTKHSPDAPCKLKFKFDGEDYEVNTKYLSSLEPYYFKDVSDTLYKNRELFFSWNKNEKNDTKVYISFKWYQSYLDQSNPKVYQGIDVEETGNFLMPYSKLSEMNIPHYGLFQLALLRYKIEDRSAKGKKIKVVNIIDCGVGLHIKEQ